MALLNRGKAVDLVFECSAAGLPREDARDVVLEQGVEAVEVRVNGAAGVDNT